MIWTLQLTIGRKLTTTLWFSVVLWYVHIELSIGQWLTVTSLVAVILARLTYTPVDLFRPNFTFNTLDFFILLTIDMHLAIINAAYPNLLVFVSKTSTGFVNTAPGISSLNQSSTRSGNRNASSNQPALKLRNDEQSQTRTVARGNLDNISLESFDSQAIMVSKSVTVVGEGQSLPASAQSLNE